MNKVKPFFRAEIGASEKSAGINKIRAKKIFIGMHLRPNKLQEKSKNLKSIQPFKSYDNFYMGGGGMIRPLGQIGLRKQFWLEF